MTGPLVTVITATFGRPQTLERRCLPSIDCQTYEPLEHIVVLDGDCGPSAAMLQARGYDPSAVSPGLRRVVQLGRNWTAPFGNGSNGAIGRLVGTYLARGDIIGVLDDDNLLEPDHVAQMVARFQETGAGMVLSEFAHMSRVIGGTPVTGNCDTSSFMYRWDALLKSNWQPDGYECDGHLAERLAGAGVAWAVKPGATMTITSQRHGAPD